MNNTSIRNISPEEEANRAANFVNSISRLPEAPGLLQHLKGRLGNEPFRKMQNFARGTHRSHAAFNRTTQYESTIPTSAEEREHQEKYNNELKSSVRSLRTQRELSRNICTDIEQAKQILQTYFNGRFSVLEGSCMFYKLTKIVEDTYNYDYRPYTSVYFREHIYSVDCEKKQVRHENKNSLYGTDKQYILFAPGERPDIISNITNIEHFYQMHNPQDVRSEIRWTDISNGTTDIIYTGRSNVMRGDTFVLVQVKYTPPPTVFQSVQTMAKRASNTYQRLMKERRNTARRRRQPQLSSKNLHVSTLPKTLKRGRNNSVNRNNRRGAENTENTTKNTNNNHQSSKRRKTESRGGRRRLKHNRKLKPRKLRMSGK